MHATHYTAFLCGCFSIGKRRGSLTAIDAAWERVTLTAEERSQLKKYYYPDFVDFCYKDSVSASAPGQGMERYMMPLNLELNIERPEGKILNLTVCNLQVYILPYKLLLYSVRISEDGADLDDITASVSVLRNIVDYNENTVQYAYEEVLRPIVEIYKAWSPVYDPERKGPFVYADLVEYGNKLKLFQIVATEMKEKKEPEKEVLLFELGTLAPTGSYGTEIFSSASPEYFDKIIRNNKVSIYNNWKALSLFDTFTILSERTEPWLLENWNEYYFGMFYIHSLFLKFYLFRMNILFRKEKCNAVALEKEFAGFERNCRFSKISYNFLPQEIYAAIDKGLEIDEESERLYEMIGQEKRIQEEKSGRRMNNLLLLLTCLTVFSAIWDFSCLVNEIYPYESNMGSGVFGYRLVSGLVLTSVLLIVLVIMLINRFTGKK